VYNGAFKWDRCHGEGTMQRKNGDVLQGTWAEGRLAKGIFISGEETYEGTWDSKGRFSGEVKNLETKESSYSGNVKNGKFEGYGVFTTTKDGKTVVEDGYWKNNWLVDDDSGSDGSETDETDETSESEYLV